MDRVLWLCKITRPVQFFASGFGAWLIAQISNGPDPFVTHKMAAAFTMSFACLGASVFHFGATHEMYARKSWDLVEVQHPQRLMIAGACAFTIAVAIAAAFLSWKCVGLVVFDALALVLYARVFPGTGLRRTSSSPLSASHRSYSAGGQAVIPT